ncbi:hypothetical protein D9756_004344 [Leucocoprinus leucothites]|uniref:Uncharacterized protein n=1 Tax=Leucocoprinus leucothites TaxID=201217 RepID=A0A8H5DAM9_9AGAR|nr:hypothetical protein D9756_004344 [Leucoagaricus leucothites]
MGPSPTSTLIVCIRLPLRSRLSASSSALYVEQGGLLTKPFHLLKFSHPSLLSYYILRMFGFSTLKAFTTEIARPFVAVGQAFRDMYTVIKAKIVFQRTHKMDLSGFTCTDIEAAGAKWVAPGLSYPGAISNTQSDTPEQQRSSFPPSPSKDTLETESIYPPTHQCKKNSTDPARDILKASTRNARVTRARAKRHSTLFGDGEKPGLAESVVMPSDTSLDASNVFVRTEAQQGRICHARTIRHQKLFGSKIEAAPTKSDGVESTLVIAALDVPVGQNIVEELNVTATEPDLDASSDFSYFTVESYDDLPTPPLLPRNGRALSSLTRMVDILTTLTGAAVEISRISCYA